MRTLLIFSNHYSPRHEYAFRTVLGNMCGLRFETTQHEEQFRLHQGPRLNYSSREIDNVLQVIPCGILDATGWQELIPEVEVVEGVHVIFADKRTPLGFDPIGAAFWMLTRYEEYGVSEFDEHGRVKASSCLMVRNNLERKPLVNQWAQVLQDEILARYPDLHAVSGGFSCRATFDLDNAYAYLGKGVGRNLLGMMKDKFNFRLRNAFNRFLVWIHARPDPYDTYTYIEGVVKGRIDASFFFLLADKGKYDRNLPFTSKRLADLINRLREFAHIGIHPGYQSHLDPLRTEAEIARLVGLIGEEVCQSRQHFLRLKVPDTYRILEKAKITSDHTMGFAECIGFRAGTCTPFTFYDVLLDRDTFVQVIPFAYMDGTLNEYMKLNPEQAIEVIDELIANVKQVNGHFECIWHNETLNEERHWKGWRKVFEHTIKTLAE